MISLSHRVFLEVAANLSFSKAAKALYISQPAISRHIHLLEGQYNCALFERKGNSIQLTVIGENIYNYLLEAKEIERKIEYEVSTLKLESEASGKLKLGASTTVSLYIIPGILSSFHQTMPKIDIQVINRNTENILTALLNKHIDVGIVEVENKINMVNYDYFTSDKVIAVCAAKSYLAKKGTLSLEELKKTPVALREIGSGTLTALTRELTRNNISVSSLNAKVRLGGTEALKNFILADLSLGFLPQKAVIKELLNGDLVEVHIENLEIKRDFFFLTRLGENFDLIRKFVRFSQRYIP